MLCHLYTSQYYWDYARPFYIWLEWKQDIGYHGNHYTSVATLRHYTPICHVWQRSIHKWTRYEQKEIFSIFLASDLSHLLIRNNSSFRHTIHAHGNCHKSCKQFEKNSILYSILHLCPLRITAFKSPFLNPFIAWWIIFMCAIRVLPRYLL